MKNNKKALIKKAFHARATTGKHRDCDKTSSSDTVALKVFFLDSEIEICRDDKSKNCFKASNCHGERPT